MLFTALLFCSCYWLFMIFLSHVCIASIFFVCCRRLLFSCYWLLPQCARRIFRFERERVISDFIFTPLKVKSSKKRTAWHKKSWPSQAETIIHRICNKIAILIVNNSENLSQLVSMILCLWCHLNASLCVWVTLWVNGCKCGDRDRRSIVRAFWRRRMKKRWLKMFVGREKKKKKKQQPWNCVVSAWWKRSFKSGYCVRLATKAGGGDTASSSAISKVRYCLRRKHDRRIKLLFLFLSLFLFHFFFFIFVAITFSQTFAFSILSPLGVYSRLHWIDFYRRQAKLATETTSNEQRTHKSVAVQHLNANDFLFSFVSIDCFASASLFAQNSFYF